MAKPSVMPVSPMVSRVKKAWYRDSTSSVTPMRSACSAIRCRASSRVAARWPSMTFSALMKSLTWFLSIGFVVRNYSRKRRGRGRSGRSRNT